MRDQYCTCDNLCFEIWVVVFYFVQTREQWVGRALIHRQEQGLTQFLVCSDFVAVSLSIFPLVDPRSFVV